MWICDFVSQTPYVKIIPYLFIEIRSSFSVCTSKESIFVSPVTSNERRVLLDNMIIQSALEMD